MLTLTIAAAPVPSAHAQGEPFSNDFSGDTLDMTKWTPVNLTSPYQGTVEVVDGDLVISPDDDPRAGESRFGVITNATYTGNFTAEATLESFEGVNGILRLQGRNGSWVELGLDSNLDTPLHVWRNFPDQGEREFHGGAGVEAPVTLGVERSGNDLTFYTISNGVRTIQATRPVASLGDTVRIMLYGYGISTTVWEGFMSTGATPMGLITGTVTGPGAAGARVSVQDTLTRPTFADAQGNYSLYAPAGQQMIAASSFGSTPATQTVTVASGQTQTVPLALTALAEIPTYDDFDGNTLDESKWVPVTVEGLGAPILDVSDSQLIITGSDQVSWRRHGVMSTSAFAAESSVMQVKLDPNPNDEPWEPFVALWDGAGVPNWNTQPHVEVAFLRDRMILLGGRAPWVTGEADQFMLFPHDFSNENLPATLTVIRTGNTYDFFVQGQNDPEPLHAFSALTGNLSSNHRIVLYSFSPNEGANPPAPRTAVWDYVRATNRIVNTTGTLTGRVLANGQPVANAGVLVSGQNNRFTARTDAQGQYSFNLVPGNYSVMAVAYGYNRSSTTQTVELGQTANAADLTLTPSSLTPVIYDDFNGATLDESKWTPVNLFGGEDQTIPELDNGDLVLSPPGAGSRTGLMATTTFPASGSIMETVVQGVQDFGPGAINAIMHLTTGDNFNDNQWIEFGIETLNAETGLPQLHVWGPETGEHHNSSPDDFPIKLTTVRRGNDLDFFANEKWVFSTTTTRLQGDHRVVLYGYGESMPRFASFSAGSAPAVMFGDLTGDGRVNVQDATLSLRIAVGSLTPTAEQTAAGDVNGDGRLNVQDTTLILRRAVGSITTFPVEG